LTLFWALHPHRPHITQGSVMTDLPLLFRPFDIRDAHLPNRIVISPMCQYSAEDGMATDWHLAHLAQFALGRAGLVFFEASAVTKQGRITHGDLGIWSDAHGVALRPIVDFLHGQGSLAAVQLAHAGRKASMQRPWFGNGPVGAEDAARGDVAWPILGATSVPLDDGWLEPQAMTSGDIADVTTAFADAAVRADAADVDVLEVHGAHGYLIQTFLSPLSNTRADAYGGDLKGRMRLALEVTEAVRAAWPQSKPLFFRVSSVDGIEGGWEIEDSIALARELKARGVDVIDCSSGGNSPKGATNSSVGRGLGFQVPFAAQIRKEADIMTQAVGLILDGAQAEDILQTGGADLIAIGREALADPYWAVHQAQAMGIDDSFAMWPEQYGWWLERRARGLIRLRDKP
jgi:2,4-dienoyl-CoA reductase-like NADH-dependent reductase (Old Yellow Enzyme family)